jgi:alpha-galactosidase
MKKILLPLALLACISFSCRPPQKIYLNQLDLSKMETGWGTVRADSSILANKLSVAGQTFEKGVGTHAISKMMIDLKGKALTFHALAGVDDESGDQASLEFIIMGDKKILWQSGIMKKGDAAKLAEVDLKGIQRLALYVSDGGDYNWYDHADWLDAWIEYRSDIPVAIAQENPEPYILTPKAADSPQINGPDIYGAGPDRFFLFKVPVTGKRPMTITAEGLPSGLSIDHVTGVITGTSPANGDYNVILRAENELGKSEKNFLIRIGAGLALTPPMGWNSWNCWGLSVSSDKVLSSAQAMISSGLAEHGWSYMNIDDGWEAAQRTPSASPGTSSATPGTPSGELLANEKFPDMKALADEVHAMGLKLGIYSGPGPLTCGGFLASYQHERQDAKTWAGWGIDYLKYDWCSYGDIAKDTSLAELQKPYILMRDALNQTGRDIVYSLCQYGMGNVWEWGADVGGNLWRTTYDINDTWNSMAGIGFIQDTCSPFAGPGRWNDQDMLVVGQVGWGPELRQSKLTPDEQYTHISLWCLLSSPLLLGCDLSQLDEFTLNLLTNNEVLAINQDVLGKQAVKVVSKDHYQVWMKELKDGSIAVGIFNTGSDDPVEAFSWDDQPQIAQIAVSWQELGIEGKKMVRDLWRQKDLDEFEGSFSASVPFHGVALVRIR